MRCIARFLAALPLAASTILQNGQVRQNPYPGQAQLITAGSNNWKTYPANASEISYKGRWDSKHISWWSAPGLKFGFTGSDVAITFGQYTDPGVLVGYRIDGLDWQFSNVTANATYQFISSATPGMNLTSPGQVVTFELRVTNWAYGVQLASVSVGSGARMVRIPNYGRTIEVIGDSLSAGQYSTYEGLTSWAWGLADGIGQAEFSITAYPGICLTDKRCYDNMRGQAYQWFQTSDTSYRAIQIWGDNPEPWDFAAHPAADVTLINIGTNDNNTVNNVTNQEFYDSYISLIDGIHKTWPKTQIIINSLWEGFSQQGTTYQQGAGFLTEILNVYDHYKDEGFVHYFNTTGILAHNDIGPQYHPTDVGAIKIASHLQQYLKLKFGWELLSTGPEIQHDTLYWNDEQGY